MNYTLEKIGKSIRIFFILFAHCFFVSNVVAQKQLYFKPYAGLMMPLCTYDKSLGKVSTFKINRFDNCLESGFLFSLRIKSNFFFTSGINFNNIGYTHKLSIPSNLVHNPYGSPVRKSSASIGLFRFPILFSYYFAEYPSSKFRPGIIAGNKKHCVKFKVTGGLCLDYIADIWNLNSGLSAGARFPNSSNIYFDTLNWKYSMLIKNNLGFSIYTGLSFVYSNRKKNNEILELTIYYNQGFIKMLHTDVEYQMNNIHGYAKLYSKGSGIGVLLTIPIRLCTFRQKKESIN
jgi:hypothetical protein